MYSSIGLLVIANFFMTFAWYGHLKDMSAKPLWIIILISWAIAFFEYCFQVPANRIGSQYYTLPQLKIIQEVITMSVFGLFCLFYMKIPLSKNFIYATLCLILSIYFIFKDLKIQ